MKKLITIATLLITGVSAAPASAQFHSYPGRTVYRGHHSSHFGSYHHNVRHQCDVARLTRLVGQLGSVSSHLHSDAHELSQGYVNSHAIEQSISRLDSLKKHMHDLLSHVGAHNEYTADVDQHVKQDTTEVRRLLTDFYTLVAGQALAGASPADQQLLGHMQEIVLHEAFPLLGRLEAELYGRAQGTLHPTICPTARPYGRTSDPYATGRTTYGPAQGSVGVGQTSYRPALPGNWSPPTPPMPPVLSHLLQQRNAAISGRRSQYRPVSRGSSLQLGGLRISF